VPGIVIAAALSLAVPSGWHVARDTSDCDPVEHLEISSAPIRHTKVGELAGPARGQVLVLVMEDHVNKPVGPLRRPVHFRVPWGHLQRLEGCCGTPSSPGALLWFRQRAAISVSSSTPGLARPWRHGMRPSACSTA
jgi:hypothetical protein